MMTVARVGSSAAPPVSARIVAVRDCDTTSGSSASVPSTPITAARSVRRSSPSVGAAANPISSKSGLKSDRTNDSKRGFVDASVKYSRTKPRPLPTSARTPAVCSRPWPAASVR